MSREQIQERIAKCRQILEANPRSQIFAALAEAYRKLGDLKTALDVCNDGLAIHPDYGSAHLVLAKIARDQKRLADAESATLKAIDLDGRTRSAELLLSDIYLQTGEFRKAGTILNRLAEADPSNQAVVRLLDLVRRAEDSAAVGRTDAVRLPSGVELQAEERKPDRDRSAPVSAPPDARPEPRPARLVENEVDPAEASWRAVLAALGRYPHLVGKLAVGYDGLLLETDLEIDSEAEAVAAMAADLYGAVRTEWHQESFGALDQILIETALTTWSIWPFPDFLLVLWCEPGINMGPLRMRLGRLERSDHVLTRGGTK